MIVSAAQTDKGLKRKTNQDFYSCSESLGLYLLADGMGGHAAGSIASKLSAETIEDFVGLAQDTRELTWPYGYDIRTPFERNVLRTALRLANAKVCQAAEQQERFAGMGSTVVAVLIAEGKAVYAHLGDSRLYLLRDGNLGQLTEDHSLVQEQLKSGIISLEQAQDHAFRNVVTRAIGVRDDSPVPIEEIELQDQDLLMLACDGLTDPLNDGQLLGLLTQHEDLDKLCRNLVDAANQAGGRDNITVVLLRYGG
ncbi:MAG: Stp1/IreP family PP2C-type Ser/Thr phosphatase [Acidobacteriota bacterium]